MNRYLKLVNFEFNRIAKLFFILLGITAISQFVGVIVISKGYMNNANYLMNEQLMSKAEFLKQEGPMSLVEVTRNILFLGPIALCAAAVAFYIFLIWYRDWFGKNTFIYRLLMLPTARMNIFFAKITTILMMTFGFVAFQLIFLQLEGALLTALVPKDFWMDLTMKQIFESTEILSMIFPISVMDFFILYGMGMMGVAILFTAILFERSYRLKGIFLGVIYSGLAILIFFSPVLIHELLLSNFFYPIELLLLMLLTGLIVLFGSLWVSHKLITKRVTV